MTDMDEEARAAGRALRDQIVPELNKAFELMEDGNNVEAGLLVLAAAAPSAAHFVATLSTLAASSADLLHQAMPLNLKGGDYYGFQGVNPDTAEPIELDAPVTFAARFLTSACNLDAEQGRVLLDTLLDTNDHDYMMECLLAMFVQAWHVHSGHTAPTTFHIGNRAVRGLGITTTDRDMEN